ncbi:MAG: bifunctional folylpolyglutamate synthase/dihydrofolate synthase [Actinomycetota bacterium]
MDFAAALAELDARKESRMVPDLSRILALATYLDDPQLAYPTIHVTGTNGKGTAASVVTAIACAHGLTTGLYTSPHLDSVTERLSVCGVDMTDQEFADEFTHLLPYLELVDARSEERVTYFEALTALAYLWFADKPVALGVFEVGMGGTWDATNLVAGDVAVITPIGLDHPELGSTLEEVAGEKAGIVKEGRVTVVREQEAAALAVLEERGRKVEATMLLEFRDWEVLERLQAVGGQAFSVRGSRATYDELFLPLFGEHAVRNAAAAIVACETLLGEPLDDASLRAALADVRWPGRLEVVARRPIILLDGAHNPSGAEALAVALREFFTWDRLHLVLSTSANKDVAGIVRPLAPLADEVYAARNESERAGEVLPIAEAVGAEGGSVSVHGSIAEALDAARAAAGPDDLICVTGSLYTVADARHALGVTT